MNFELDGDVKVQKSGKGGPVPTEVLQAFLDESGYPRAIKSQIVTVVQTNNRKGIYEYTLDFVPGAPVKVENGRFVK